MVSSDGPPVSPQDAARLEDDDVEQNATAGTASDGSFVSSQDALRQSFFSAQDAHSPSEDEDVEQNATTSTMVAGDGSPVPPQVAFRQEDDDVEQNATAGTAATAVSFAEDVSAQDAHSPLEDEDVEQNATASTMVASDGSPVPPQDAFSQEDDDVEQNATARALDKAVSFAKDVEGGAAQRGALDKAVSFAKDVEGGAAQRPSRVIATSRRRASVHGDQSRLQAMEAATRMRPIPDPEILAKAVADAGLNAFGCVWVEMYVLSEDGTEIFRPEGGNWMNPAFASSLPTDALIEKAWELDRTAETCPPGAGLAGILADESGLGSGQVHWRQIKVLLKDPYVQRGSGRRMEKMFEVGIGLVASVPFSFIDGKGLVLFYSRSSANSEELQSDVNIRYMISSANLIGAGYSIRKSRDSAAKMRRKKYLHALRKVKHHCHQNSHHLSTLVQDKELMKSLRNIRTTELASGGGELGDGDADSPQDVAERVVKQAHHFGRGVVRRVKNSVKKWRGSKLHGPPPQQPSACLFAFVGVFLVMLTVLKVERALEDSVNLEIVGGWYASTLCILFALTPAPVGQPRQILLGHLWNILVGMLCRSIPTDEEGEFEHYVAALAVALGIGGAAFFGILHPPATGLSLAFATNLNLTWGSIGLVVLVDAMVVFMSMIILNLSEKQQYPMWWLGLGYAATGGSRGHMMHVARREWRRLTGQGP